MKESREEYIGGFGRRKGRDVIMYYNFRNKNKYKKYKSTNRQKQQKRWHQAHLQTLGRVNEHRKRVWMPTT